MHIMNNNFLEKYQQLKNEFLCKNGFEKIQIEDSKINWPEYSGVYVIWERNHEELTELIYVGMTGKFYNENGITKFNNGNINKRVLRWTPYRFCENDKDGRYKFYFRFGPKEKNTDKQAKIKFQEDAYRFNISYSNIEIHCFKIESNHEIYTPTFLEAELLANYIKSYKRLPKANNEH